MTICDRKMTRHDVPSLSRQRFFLESQDVFSLSKNKKKRSHAFFELTKHFVEALAILIRLNNYLENIKVIFSSPYMPNMRMFAGTGVENGNFGSSMDELS